MPTTYTICFCGTDCWPDEGIGRNQGSFGPSGYIPVKIFNDIRTGPKEVIPGAGAPYAAFHRSLYVPRTNLFPNQYTDTALGYSMLDLAGDAAARIVGVESTGRGPEDLELVSDTASMQTLLDARSVLGLNLIPANRAAPITGERYQFSVASIRALLRFIQPTRGFTGPIQTINLIGHSRGGVTAILCAHELEYLFPDAAVNIFAIDPVPGAGYLPEPMTRLARNVKNYVAVYAADEVSEGFNGVVPQPLRDNVWIDPLEVTAGARIDIPRYHLIYTPGRHGTIAGNHTLYGDGTSQASTEASMVGRLVNHLARACLRAWGTDVPAAPGNPSLDQLQAAMTAHGQIYRAMRSHTYTGPVLPGHLSERGITSTDGLNPFAWCYLEDATGDPLLVARSSPTRPNPGTVKWQSIQSVPDSVFTSGVWPNDA